MENASARLSVWLKTSNHPAKQETSEDDSF